MIYIKTDDNNRYLIRGQLPESLLNEIPSMEEVADNLYSCPLLPFSSFALAAYAQKNSSNVQMTETTKKALQYYIKEAGYPELYLVPNEPSQVFMKIPSIPAYSSLMKDLDARHRRLNIYSMRQSRLFQLYRTILGWEHEFLPKPRFTEDLQEYITRELRETQDFHNLFDIKPDELYSIRYGYQMNTEKAMNKLKLHSIADILLSRPRRYEDRKSTVHFHYAPFGLEINVIMKVKSMTTTLDGKQTTIEGVDPDNDKEFRATMYGGYYLQRKIKPDDIIYLKGRKIYKKNSTHDKTTFSINALYTESEVNALPIAPIYPASPSNGYNVRVITDIVTEMMERFDGEELFSYVRGSERDFWSSIQSLHFPKDINDYLYSIESLAYYEMVSLQLQFLYNKSMGTTNPGVPKSRVEDGLMTEALSKIPFDLTKGQDNAINEMIDKMDGNKPADVLLSGDVGSGKSLVATLLSLHVVDNKQQVVIAAPTEVLARQLYSSVTKVTELLENPPVVEFLSGALDAKSQREIKKRAKEGDIDIIVGTHSVFNIEYDNLGFVVIDEQQKFGAAQRDKLKHSGRKDGKQPDVLSQTATPIPRSTALAFYGDIDLIQIHDKPAGRREIITKWIKKDAKTALNARLGDIWQMANREIEKGNQVFMICPAVEETSQENFISTKQAHKIVEKIAGKGMSGMVHGQMSKKKQEEILKDFRDKKFPILIGSSILEVGIDIPQATVMIVLDADRFGASSLHQIRGRVGRNSMQSYCLLVSASETEGAKSRLNALVESTDGFEIALTDLRTRNEGDILGVRQSGESNLRFCNFVDHVDMVEPAKAEAQRIFRSPLKEQALIDSSELLGINRGGE